MKLQVKIYKMQWIINDQQSAQTTITIRNVVMEVVANLFSLTFRSEFFRSNNFLIDFRIIGDFRDFDDRLLMFCLLLACFAVASNLNSGYCGR